MAERPSSIDDFLNESYAAYTSYCLSLSGLQSEVKKFQNVRPTKTNPNPKLLIGKGHPSEGNFVSFIYIKDLKEKSKKGGEFEDSLSKQALFYIFTLWEEKYRGEIAKQLGIKKEKVMCNLLGEVRLIRNRITHVNSVLDEKVLDRLPILRDNFGVGFFTLNRDFMSDFMNKLNKAEIYLSEK